MTRACPDTGTDPGTGTDRTAFDGVIRSWDLLGEDCDEEGFRVAVRAWGTAAGLPLPGANAAEQDAAVLAGDVVARLASLDRAAAARALGFTSTHARARLAPPAQGAAE